MRTPWPLASLALVLTGACNLRCEYCFQSRKRRGRMPWPTARAAISCLQESRRAARRLVLTGGEPLLAFPLIRRIVRIVEPAARRARPIRISVITNGTRMGDEEAAFLAANRVDVQISLDGGAAAQAGRGAETFSQLDVLLDHLRRRHRAWFARHVSVAVTITPANVRHLAGSVEYLLSKRVQAVRFSPAIGVPSGWSGADLKALGAQFRVVADLALAHCRRTGRVPLGVLRPTSARAADPFLPMCGIADGTKAVVDVDGQVYACSPVLPVFGTAAPQLLKRASRAMRLGHIADAHLGQRLSAYREAVRATGLFGPRGGLRGSIGPCRACRYAGGCVVCPLTIAYEPGNADPRRVPDSVCAFNRAALAGRERFQRRARSAVASGVPGAVAARLP
jgi:sulfatase maturation enzyme AslB (radical SAM superfamily)